MASATSASCQSSRTVTVIIMARVIAAETEGNDPIDQILDRRYVMLDSIEGVGGATRVVIRHGEALDLVHEPGAEIEDEPFADVGLQQRARKPLELAERRDGNQQANREQQDRGGGLRGGFREERLQEHGQWVPTEDRIHRNFERQPE